MTIICGEAQATLRLKFACEEDYQATLTAILEQSVNLSRLVDDLLLLIRAAMNQLNLAVITIKIKLLLNTEVLKWERQHRDCKVILVTDSTSAATEVVFDIPRIQ